MWRDSFHNAIYPAILQSIVYKNHFFCIFFAKNLHISEKSSTFAP